jgi:putative nucleotidyltransferase with HDIG domain
VRWKISSSEWQLHLYVGVISGLAIAAGALLAALDHSVGNIFLLGALAASAVAGERWNVQLSSTTVFSVAMLPIGFAAVVSGPLAAGIVGAAGMLGEPELLSGRRPLRWLTYTSTSFLAGATAGVAASAVEPLSSTRFSSAIIMTFAAIAAGEATDFLLAATTSLVRGKSLAAMTNRVLPVIVTSFLVYAPVVALLVAAYSVTPWTIPLFLVPALALQRVYTLYQRQRSLADELTESNGQLVSLNDELESANLSFAVALVQTLEESDRYTAGHSRAVANYARDIALQMGLDADRGERVYLCGLVHDIGKIGLSPALLNKEGRLNLDERREMERHSEIGERILRKVDAYADVAQIVRHHHERFDGEGYPDRLRGEDIPFESRIIAVADAYNAMTSDRPYRKAMPYEIARDRLLQAMGSQFFVEPVVAFLAVLASQSEDYRFARGSAFEAGDIVQLYEVLSDTSAADAA